jgi:predicted outer membrane repeat protein
VTDCVFSQNTANDHGGGLHVGNPALSAAVVEISRNLIIGNQALGADGAGAPDGSGGGIWMSRHGSYFHHNTLAFNTAVTQSGKSAPTGGVLLFSPEEDVRVEYNIIYANEGGGIGVYGSSGTPSHWDVTLTRNLIYANTPQDTTTAVLVPGSTITFALNEDVFMDPLFCIEGPESRGELAFGSPALTQPFGVIGAVDHGSCELNTAPQVLKTTWQTIKAIYPH